MAQSDIQRLINRVTGVSRRTSGAATKNKKRINNAMRRKSNGGAGK